MPRHYTLPYSGTLTNAGGDMDFEIAPGDDKPIQLCGWIIGQTSEVGDTAEEGIRVSIIRLPATVTSGSGGSTVTAAALDSADSASGATLEANNTTVATTSGSAVTLIELAWNERGSPYTEWLPEEFRPTVKQGEALVVRFQTTVADDLSLAATFFIKEN